MKTPGKLIATAYIKARASIGATVVKDAKANYGRYATLPAVLELITPALSANGLALIQEPVLDNDMVIVHATLLHESGEVIEWQPIAMPVAGTRTAQAIGSAITYARRYQITALLGIAADDDDGAAASTMTVKAPTRPVEATTTIKAAPVPIAQENATEADLADSIEYIDELGKTKHGDNWSAKRKAAAAYASSNRTQLLEELTEVELSDIILKLEPKP